MNPESGRCVKRSGIIGRQINKDGEYGIVHDLSRKHTQNINPSIARLYSNTLFQTLSELNPVFEKKLGKGGFGSVYKATIDVNGETKPVVVKIMDDSNNIARYEYDIQTEFKNAGILVPRPILYRTFKNKGRIFAIIIMSLDEFTTHMGVFQDWLEKKQPIEILDDMLKSVDLLLTAMCAKNFVHGDFHWGNIAFQNTSTGTTIPASAQFVIEDRDGDIVIVSPLLIDFGWASEGKCRPDLEILQLIRTLDPDFKIHKENRKYLKDGLLELLQKYKSTNPYYADKIDYNKFNNYNQIHALWDRVHRNQYEPDYNESVKIYSR
jgi:hypothetical protein